MTRTAPFFQAVTAVTVTALAVCSLGAGCSSRTVYVRDDPPPPPPREVVVHQRPTPQVLRADDVDAGHVTARVVYADVVYARSSNIGQIVKVRGGHGGHGNAGRGNADLSASTIAVDALYVDELHADFLQADIVYAHQVILGAPAVHVRHRPQRPAVRHSAPRVDNDRGKDAGVIVARVRDRDQRVAGTRRKDAGVVVARDQRVDNDRRKGAGVIVTRGSDQRPTKSIAGTGITRAR